MRPSSLLCSCALLAGCLCEPPRPPAPPASQPMRKGYGGPPPRSGQRGPRFDEKSPAATTAARAVRGLEAAVRTAIEEGVRLEPEAALDLYRERVRAFTEEQARLGTRVGRTSHKLRSAENAPPAWVKPLLLEFVRRPSLASRRGVPLEGGALGYVEPIYSEAVCLACHGQAIERVVIRSLGRAYPKDQATGFAAGDLHGLYWAEVDPAK